MQAMLAGLGGAGLLRLEASERESLARSMVVLATYWLNYEFVCNPREALEPSAICDAMLRGTRHTLQLVVPYLGAGQRAELVRLANAPAPEEDALST